MTATPIPRTLAMTVYGDLDVSIIDELPPGRKPITTLHYHELDRPKLYDGIRYQLQMGVQVYFVYPLIAESEKIDLKNLEEGFVNLEAAFPEYQIGKVHGKMLPAEKDAVMQDFKQGKYHILVSTTVIEVGVNVPNAAVMVVENAERFGLSQLHQLRGRVGRGENKSYCILMTKNKLAENTQKRIAVMTETQDGFVIAEEDMKLRGPGDLEGTAQSGLPFNLKVANLTKDVTIMEQETNLASLMDYLMVDQMMGEMDHMYKSFNMYYTNTSSDAENGKLNFGPVWDYDAALLTTFTSEPNVQYTVKNDFYYSNVFFKAVANTPDLYIELKTRYNNYGKQALENAISSIEEIVPQIENSLKANHELWYKGYPMDMTDKNVEFLLAFLKNRLTLFGKFWIV